MTVNNQLQNQLQKQNPPIPPLAVALASDPVPLEVRRLRVANGSQRKRDLAAVRMANELQRLESVSQADAEVTRCWVKAKERIKADLPSSAFEMWFAPLELAGVSGTALVLSAPDSIRTWTERRYAGLLREALSSIGCEYHDIDFMGVAR